MSPGEIVLRERLGTVLVTGGRSPVALEMCRLFGRRGWTVVVAESEGGLLCAASRYVQAYYKVPSPRFRTAAFIAALLEIVRAEGVGILVPTCEEIFYISRHRGRLSRYCQVFAPEFSILERLHCKDRFIEHAHELGLAVPETWVLSEQVLAAIDRSRKYVVKPVYSRFGCETKIVSGKDLRWEGRGRQWVVQTFLEGEGLHAYAIAREGRVLSGVIYKALAKEAATGPSIAFEAVECSSAEKWLRRFVEANAFSGQISFDFIVDAAGTARAIECNPRATSGLHLLAEDAAVVRAIIDGAPSPLGKTRLKPKGLRLPSLFVGARDDFKDVVFRWADPLPALAQCVTILGFLLRALWNRRSLEEELVHDLCWNGEPIE
ncbi:ATP-grasp domain-containing protein [Pelagicoccus sp. NFK12]|uniref:ATP-grasp domain-containing protein n=1 Tax=Pelagicoccus enzymogenes TaxID=2773457 RepID=A0A927II48_9BACT|nr:ATP-grasp domain-containing protein [Pelagicoccus enzymogenes]MBD5780886.1 ATP-grasp domain-containing protein [Pelagicoccus enzymogenes]